MRRGRGSARKQRGSERWAEVVRLQAGADARCEVPVVAVQRRQKRGADGRGGGVSEGHTNDMDVRYESRCEVRWLWHHNSTLALLRLNCAAIVPIAAITALHPSSFSPPSPLLSTLLSSLSPRPLLLVWGACPKAVGKVAVKCRFQCFTTRIGEPPTARSVAQPRLRGIPPYFKHQVVAGLHYWAPKCQYRAVCVTQGAGRGVLGGHKKGRHHARTPQLPVTLTRTHTYGRPVGLQRPPPLLTGM